jgi:hypothetical protein
MGVMGHGRVGPIMMRLMGVMSQLGRSNHDEIDGGDELTGSVQDPLHPSPLPRPLRVGSITPCDGRSGIALILLRMNCFALWGCLRR